MHEDLFEIRSDYFNSAYLGPMPLLAKKKVTEAVERSLDPASLAYDEWYQRTDQIRRRFGDLLLAPWERIAISTSVSELVSHVANGLELHPQDEILLMNGDYPSMILPWMVMAELKGFRIFFLEPREFMDPDKFKKHISERTRLAACSHVMFNTGIRLPVAELGRLARAHEFLFLADTSQSFGGMSITREIVENVDILVGVAYKWLLGPYGSAYGHFSPFALQEVRRTHASWLVSPNSATSENLLNYTTQTLPGARRFDRGQSPSFLINAALEGALQVLSDVGLARIERHNAGLVRLFLENLPRGFEVAGSPGFESNIVCVRPPSADAMAVKQKLAMDKIDVSVREGYLRLAFHFFNSEAQVQRLLEKLPRD